MMISGADFQALLHDAILDALEDERDPIAAANLAAAAFMAGNIAFAEHLREVSSDEVVMH